jgi:hypothetical protein
MLVFLLDSIEAELERYAATNIGGHHGRRIGIDRRVGASPTSRHSLLGSSARA